MPLINILPKKKIKDYEEPPVFSAQQRKYFLTMPASIGAKVNSFPGSVADTTPWRFFECENSWR